MYLQTTGSFLNPSESVWNTVCVTSHFVFFLFFCEASCGARWTHHVQGFSVWLMLGQPSWMGFLKAFLNISAYEVEQPRICEWVLLMAISPKGEIGKLIAWVYFYILYFTNMCFPQMVKCLF